MPPVVDEELPPSAPEDKEEPQPEGEDDDVNEEEEEEELDEQAEAGQFLLQNLSLRFHSNKKW